MSDSDQYLQNRMVGNEGITVPAKRIDTIAAELGLEQIDLLKMNIEGAERAALLGTGQMLTATRHVCISCHDFLAEAGGPDELRTKAFVTRFLSEHGFEVTTRDNAPEPWTRDYVYGVKA